MTAFDKAREIAKTTIISNSFDRAAVEIAKALLAYEPTPDATEEAQKIFNEIIKYGKHGYGANLMASAIARATAATRAEIENLGHSLRTRARYQTLAEERAEAAEARAAASEARVRELEAALRILAIVQHVRMVQGGGLVTNGKSCKVCKTEWDDDAPEKHADNCVLHHTDTVGGAR